jgi:hypothetical protein
MADLETILTEGQIAEINDLHKQIEDKEKGGYALALKIGKQFQIVKAKLRHGKWIKWLEANCPKITRRTASTYLQLAENHVQLEASAAKVGKHVSHLSIRNAVALIDPDYLLTAEEKKRKKEAEAAARKAKKLTDAKKAAADATEEKVREYIGSLSADAVGDLIKEAHDDTDYINTVAEHISPAPDLKALLNACKDAEEVIDAFDPQQWEADDLDTIASTLMGWAQEMRTLKAA